MTFFIGRPGSLIALPHPGRGINASLPIPANARTTIGGGQVVDRAPTGRRIYELAWRSLSPEQHSIVEELWLGAKGPGPFAFIDPWRRNLLTAQQSSATSVTNTTTGFTVGAVAESLASVTTPVERGPRALAWSLPAAVTSGILNITAPYSVWPGIPTVPGRSYRLQASVRGGGTDTVVDVTASLRWLDTAGATLSTDTGSAVTTSAGAWGAPNVTATSPSNAVYVLPRLAVAAGSVSNPAIVYVDRPILCMPTTANPGTAWVLGTGVPLVSCTTSGTGYRKPIKRTADLTLVEVG